MDCMFYPQEKRIAYKNWKTIIFSAYQMKKGQKRFEKYDVAKEWWEFSGYYKWYLKNHYWLPNNEEILPCCKLLMNDNYVFDSENTFLIPKKISDFIEKPDDYGIMAYDTQYSVRIKSPISGEWKFYGYWDKRYMAVAYRKAYRQAWYDELVKTYEGKIPERTYEVLKKYRLRY